MHNSQSVRADKFLWAVRIYKTRSIAAEECRKGRIFINGNQIKPSRLVSKDEIIVVKKMPVTYTFRIINSIESRVSSRLVHNYIDDLTPDEEKQKLQIKQSGLSEYRQKGTGRPTKRERRNLDRLRIKFENW